MIELITTVFALVCGQNPAHTWTPGGLALPCCQRCTGLYVGAAVAVALLLWLRPRPSGRFLEMHGLCLLQMAPFGFHWLPQGPGLRTLTGLLFGFGVVAFLWLVPAARWQDASPRMGRATLIYGLVLFATGALLPVVASVGGVAGAVALSALAVVGALTLLALVATNLLIGGLTLARKVIGAKARLST